MAVLKTLILEPLSKLDASRFAAQPMLIVLDALDEAGVDQTRSKLLEFLSNDFIKKLPSGVKLFVTGRPEADIVKHLKRFSHDIDEEGYRAHHERDLRLYIENGLKPFLSVEAERQRAVDVLMAKSEGKFVYTALIQDTVQSAMEEIEADGGTITIEGVFRLLDALPRGIDECYERYMTKMDEHAGSSGGDNRKKFLSVMVASAEPLTWSEVKFFCRLEENELKEIKEKVKSIFPYREDSSSGTAERCKSRRNPHQTNMTKQQVHETFNS